MPTIKLAEILGKKKKYSCGIVAYLRNPFRVLLARPGGPLSSYSYWSIPKGKLEKNENKWNCAVREFQEETNLSLPNNSKKLAIDLGEIVQKNNKIVKAWAVEMENDDVSGFRSNKCKTKFSGKEIEIPEIDKIEYFGFEEFSNYINPDQIPLIYRLHQKLGASKKNS